MGGLWDFLFIVKLSSKEIKEKIDTIFNNSYYQISNY